jgi:hypothetical protein
MEAPGRTALVHGLEGHLYAALARLYAALIHASAEGLGTWSHAQLGLPSGSWWFLQLLVWWCFG